MRCLRLILALLALYGGSLTGQPSAPPSTQEQIGRWLNPSLLRQDRLDSLLELISRNEFHPLLIQSHAANRKAVTDALIYSFSHGQVGHQCAALQLGVWVQDRACYSQMLEPALRSPSYELRSLALGSALFFEDRSEIVIAGIVSELGKLDLITARNTASQLAAKWNLPEAIEPLLNLITHTNVTWASIAAGSLSAYAYLPPESLVKLEAALARAEYKATNMVRYTNTTLFSGQPVSHAWAVDGLVTALRKAKEKAQLTPPPEMEPPKTVGVAKKAQKSAADGRISLPASRATEKDLPATSPESAGDGGRTLMVSLGLASFAVIAWLLIKGRLR